jgi:hypothetical protein
MFGLSLFVVCDDVCDIFRFVLCILLDAFYNALIGMKNNVHVLP